MSPARHTTHNPRHGLGSRLGWSEISTGATTSDAGLCKGWVRRPSGLASLHHTRLSTRSSYQLYSFSGDCRFCYDNHGSFVYDSPNLFCGPSGSVRTGLTGVRSEPGHRTHLTSLIMTTPSKFQQRLDIGNRKTTKKGHLRGKQNNWKTKKNNLTEQ